MESGDGDWRTPKVSHVRPTVRHHLHQVQQALGSNSDSSPGVPAQASTPFPPLEEGPLTPSTNPTPQMPPTIERRVGRIEEEVQSIAVMLKNELLVGRGDAETAAQLQQENERLRRQAADLEAILKDSEERLSNLQEGVASLQEEYRTESEELVRRVAELAQAAEEETERREECQRNRERTERSRLSLEKYINTLPSQEEFEGLRRKFRMKEEEVERLHTSLADSKAKEAATAKEKFDLAQHLDHLKNKVTDLELQLNAAKEEISAGVRRQEIVAEMVGEDRDATGLEAVLKERDAVQKDLDRLKRYLNIAEAKHKREMKCLATELGEVRRELRESSTEVTSAKEALMEERSTSCFLREDLTRARGEAAAARHRVEATEKELLEAMHAGEDAARADGVCSVLAREMGRCARDLRSLAQAARQLSRGEDPAVNHLLGIADSKSYVEEALEAAPEPPAQRLSRGRALLAEVKETREEIAAMRDELSDKYAESLGNNFNSCITQ